MKLRNKLQRIRRAHPNGPTDKGQIYSGALDESVRWTGVTLYVLFVSDEGTHLLRPHVFAGRTAKNSAEWAAWFKKHLYKIHKNPVLPNIGVRTDKSWAVKQILGWAGNAKYKTDSPKVAKRRNKTKSQRK